MKYNPADFSHVLGLSDDLTTFYKLHDEYMNDKTQSKRFAMEKQSEYLFFTIKHRALEGTITSTTAHELREQLYGVLDERRN